MLKHILKMAVVIGVGALGFATTAKADMPPGSYDKLRAGADEALVIHVTSVKTTDTPKGKDVTVEAKVLCAERSGSGLKKGATLTIKYEAFDRDKLGSDWGGPRLTPVLEKDGVYPAFLTKAEGGKGYQPAAHGESFKMTPESR